LNKILADTSVWIDLLNLRESSQASLLKLFIEIDAPVVLCPPVIQEVLQGIKEDKDYRQVKDLFSGFEILKLNPEEAAYGAATLYRQVRKKGITIRKSFDCLIAFYCISCKATLLHNDADFDKIAQHSSLMTIE
jgi:predicted nucleic acid-binding protein